MARSVSEEIAWKPRRLRQLDSEARVAHLQRNLPPGVREVFAADDTRTASGAPEAEKPKRSKFAVLPWEPRSGGEGSS